MTNVLLVFGFLLLLQPWLSAFHPAVEAAAAYSPSRIPFLEIFYYHFPCVKKLHAEAISKRPVQNYIDLEGRRNSRVAKALEDMLCLTQSQ